MPSSGDFFFAWLSGLLVAHRLLTFSLIFWRNEKSFLASEARSKTHFFFYRKPKYSQKSFMLMTKVHWKISQNKFPGEISGFIRIFRFAQVFPFNSEFLKIHGKRHNSLKFFMLMTKVHWNISRNKIPDEISGFIRIFRFVKVFPSYSKFTQNSAKTAKFT